MAIEPFEITTVYPDGTSETRMSTAEEMAQRELDFAEALRVETEVEQARIAAEAKQTSARQKLAALGLDEDEINAIIR